MRHPERLSSMPPSILTPPIVPTQSLGSTYGSSAFTRSQDRHQSQLLERRKKVDVNPLWLYWQQFQNYRKKQDEKDDKSVQKWPQVLEDAFLDGKMSPGALHDLRLTTTRPLNHPSHRAEEVCGEAGTVWQEHAPG